MSRPAACGTAQVTNFNGRCVLHAAEGGSQGFTSFYLGNLVPTAGRPGQRSPSLPTSTARVAPEKSVYPDPACRGFLRRVDGVIDGK